MEERKKLRELAIKATTLSKLMDGREKIETEEIIRKYPQGIRITAIDSYNATNINEETGEALTEEIFVYTFEEDETKFAFAGYVLKKMFSEWLDDYGDFDAVNEELEYSDFAVQLSRRKTKDGKKSITTVRII